jgi:putative spermidine/putrescine transport system permease protein
VTALSETALPRARPRRRRGRGLWPLLPLCLFLVVLFLYPVAQLLAVSVVDAKGTLTLANYARLFASPVYLQVLAITFKISLWTTLLCLVGAYPVAYLLATTREATRNSLLLWVLLPFWTSFLVRTFAWIVLLGRNGAINKLLLALGITDAPVALVYDLTGVLIGMTHALMPLAILTMCSVMQGIPQNLVPAAGTLGARGGQAFWRIYFPLSLPGVAASGLMVFITALGFFITPALLGGSRETMITQVIIENIQGVLNWGFAGAVSVLLLATSLLVFLLYDRLLGMSTLAGETAAPPGAGARRGAIGRLGAAIGVRLVAALGTVCAAAGALGDALRRARPDRPPLATSRGVLRAATVLLILFLAVPSFFVVPISFTEKAFMEWPPVGFTLKWYEAYFASPLWISATIRSLVVGVLSAAAATLIAVPAAFVLVRRHFFGKTAILAFILSPLILPRMIIALALFYLYARVGLVGTTAGLVLGHTVLAVPYVVITVMAVLKGYDERLDQAAGTLGANRLQTLRHVTLPLIRPGIVSAFLFAFIVSFDELTIALFVTGGLSATLPKQMWDDAVLKVSPGLAAVSTVMLVFITAMILAAEWLRRRSLRA